MINLAATAEGVIVPVRAQPGAKKNCVLGERAGMLRIAVSVAPEKGKANAAIVEVLADALGCKKSQLSLLHGETSREKKILVAGMALETLRERLDALTSERPAPEN